MNSSQADGNVLFVWFANKNCKFISYHISVSTLESNRLWNSMKFVFDIDICVARFSTFLLSSHIYCLLNRSFSKIFAFVLFV